MNFFELIKLSFKSLFGFKLRSFLTTLGIIVGIGSVVMISSLGTGFQEGLLGDVTKAISKMLIVSLDEKKIKNININRTHYFIEDDLKVINTLPNVESAFFADNLRGIDSGDNIYNIFSENGITFDAFGYELVAGRFFTKEELNVKSNVALISKYDAVRRFGSESAALGKTLKFDLDNYESNITLTIVGVYLSKDDSARNLFGGNHTEIMITKSQYNPSKFNNNLIVKVKDESKIKETIGNINLYLNIKSKNLDIYYVDAMAKDLNQITGILDKVSIFISLVAGISLAVGGIGVMNIMLVSVTERISEIGLRKAIGAKNKDILLQFLIESITLTFLGGLIGIIFGYSLALLIGIPFKIVPVLKLNILVVSVLVSTFTGLIFGIYPARKAAKLSPMEALRSE